MNKIFFNLNQHAMKKSTLSALLVAGAMILSLGASAQVVDGNYSEYDANLTAPTNIDYVTLKTGGTTMGYYALPDPVYHPNYNAAGSWALTAGFVWDWTIPTNPGAATVTYPVATKPANYVEITYPALGSYVVNVAEHAPAAFGGCVDATPTVMNVTVIAPPTATVTTADVTNYCGDQAAQPISISFTENIPDAMAAFAFGVNEVVETIDPSDVVLSVVTASHSVVDFPTTGKAKTGTAGFVAATPNFTYGFNSAALAVSGGQRTRYTYTLVKASDAPGAAADGVISAISQKSDFVSGVVSTYPITDNQVVFIVNPTPSTGPIYHIANNFAY